MKKKFILPFFFISILVHAQPNYLKTWATYFGDESIKIADSEMDSQGNIYIVGKVQQNQNGQFNLTTPNAHQEVFGGGNSDGFIAKFSMEGNLLWATYFGGENIDVIEAISIDKYDNIYCIGATNSAQNISTENAFQTQLEGLSAVFIVKLNPLGSVFWSTYFGGNIGVALNNGDVNSIFIRSSIINDTANHFYIAFQTSSTNLATTGVFQEIKNDAGSVIAKFSDTGNRVWATYYGSNASYIASIDIGQTGLFLTGLTVDCPPNFTPNTYFSTPNCHQPSPGSCSDTFITKFSFDGQRIWSTYYGGTSTERNFNNNLKCNNGFVYVSGMTSSNTNITTPNSFQSTKINSTYTNYLVKFNENGERIWGSYVGENNNFTNFVTYYNSVRIKIFSDTIYLFGGTFLIENISTANSFQPIINSINDGYIIKFNPDGQREWGSYFGGNLDDQIMNVLFKNDSFFLLGRTQSQSGITTAGALQSNFLYNNSPWAGLTIDNTFIARFDPNPLSLNDAVIADVNLYPNPNNGSFSISSIDKIETVEIVDMLGKLVFKNKNNSNEYNINGISKGLYLVKVTFDNDKVLIKKMIVK